MPPSEQQSPAADETPRAVETPRAPGKRRIVFVVGSGRSGTSTMSGALQTLGMRVPQPEVEADSTNPKGFGEPKWVVDFHTELLARAGVQVSDARPEAWFAAGRLSTDEELRQRLHTWLEGEFAQNRQLVIKDPRLAWFLGLWRSAALRCDASPAYLTMLRPVTEVVGSKRQHYGSRFGDINRTAAWVNMMLHTERATRGSQRAFVRYHDMLTDWTVPVFALGESLDLDAVTGASANSIRAVHAFIDPGLRRVQATWDDIDVPAALREIADESWTALNGLADPGGDTAAAQARLDDLRSSYTELYDTAAALTQSSAVAAFRDGAAGAKAPARPGAVTERPAAGGASRPEPAPSRRRLADRLPHGLRALVPAGLRRRIRQVLGRER